MPQSLDRIEMRGAASGEIPENDADQRGKCESNKNNSRFDDEWHSQCSCGQEGETKPKQNPDQTTEQRKHYGFDQEL